MVRVISPPGRAISLRWHHSLRVKTWLAVGDERKIEGLGKLKLGCRTSRSSKAANKSYFLSMIECRVSSTHDLGKINNDVITTLLGLNEADPTRGVKPLHDTLFPVHACSSEVKRQMPDRASAQGHARGEPPWAFTAPTAEEVKNDSVEIKAPALTVEVPRSVST